jgi:hypothetical protein
LGIEQADIVYLHNRVARQRVLRPGSMGSQLCPHRHMARVIPVPNGPSGRAQSGQCIGRGCSFLDSRKLGSRS